MEMWRKHPRECDNASTFRDMDNRDKEEKNQMRNVGK